MTEPTICHTYLLVATNRSHQLCRREMRCELVTSSCDSHKLHVRYFANTVEMMPVSLCTRNIWYEFLRRLSTSDVAAVP